MAKAFRKTMARKQARQAGWEKHFASRRGFKPPGSNKKPFSLGKRR
jgi:hypothetical protein